MKKIVIGVTGPTGAGKSNLREIFRENGYIVIDADTVARDVTDHNEEVRENLKSFFGNDIIDNEGKLNRRLLSKRAFSEKKNSDMLNSIVHPAVIDTINSIIKASDTGCVIDAPLLFEAGCEKLCDTVVAVTAPFELRKNRICARDGISQEEALARMKAQKDDAYYTERSDRHIENSGSQTEFGEKILQLIKEIETEYADE